MAAALALQLDIWSSGYTPMYGGNFELEHGGSLLEVSDGRFGQNILSSNLNNKSVLDSIN